MRADARATVADIGGISDITAVSGIADISGVSGISAAIDINAVATGATALFGRRPLQLGQLIRTGGKAGIGSAQL